MLVFVEGSDSFLAKQAIDQIKQKYLEKNPDGVELSDIDTADGVLNWADLQAVPLFAQTRLVVLRRIGQLSVVEQESLASFLSASPASTVVVLWDEKALPAKSTLAGALQAAKRIAANPLSGSHLKNHLIARAKQQNYQLSDTEVQQLISEHGSDLWAQETAVAVLALGGRGEAHNKIHPSEQFALYRAVQTGNWRSAANFIRQDIAAGAPIELLIGTVASALRKRPASPERKAVTEVLADVDLGLKTGLLDEESAAALFITELPNRRQNRVKWEALWEESLGG